MIDDKYVIVIGHM